MAEVLCDFTNQRNLYVVSFATSIDFFLLMILDRNFSWINMKKWLWLKLFIPTHQHTSQISE